MREEDIPGIIEDHKDHCNRVVMTSLSMLWLPIVTSFSYLLYQSFTNDIFYVGPNLVPSIEVQGSGPNPSYIPISVPLYIPLAGVAVGALSTVLSSLRKTYISREEFVKRYWNDDYHRMMEDGPRLTLEEYFNNSKKEGNIR